jgi:uncharacterized membrane protein YcaP (DUF421 family)
MLRRNMRRELITEEELWARLREQGVDDLAKVKLPQIEPDGSVSVIAAGRSGSNSDRRRHVT